MRKLRTIQKKKPLVLYIEDEQALTRVVSNKLQREGFRVVVATNGDEGFQKLKSAKPDLVLLDLMLPDRSGFELLEQMKQEKISTKQVPVLVFSNLSQESDIRRCKKLGVADYFVKSDLSIQEVIEKIQKHLKRKR